MSIREGGEHGHSPGLTLPGWQRWWWSTMAAGCRGGGGGKD
jgi:hypothetical protein